MLSKVAQFPEVVARYPRQIELEETISHLVHRHQGLKETDLWIMTMAAMYQDSDGPPLAIVAGTVRRMLERGSLVGVDYAISEHGNTFVLPAETLINPVPVRVPKTSAISVLHPHR
jgi:hypothetical protein